MSNTDKFTREQLLEATRELLRDATDDNARFAALALHATSLFFNFRPSAAAVAAEVFDIATDENFADNRALLARVGGFIFGDKLQQIVAEGGAE